MSLKSPAISEASLPLVLSGMPPLRCKRLLLDVILKAGFDTGQYKEVGI